MIRCEESSARKQRLGHISKQGNSLLRFLLVEAAQAAARIHPDWRRRYIHLAMRRHKSIAKVAMGRRLAVRLYWMWRNGCDYSPSLEFGSRLACRRAPDCSSEHVSSEIAAVAVRIQTALAKAHEVGCPSRGLSVLGFSRSSTLSWSACSPTKLLIGWRKDQIASVSLCGKG